MHSRFAQRESIRLTLLADDKAEIIKAFDLVSPRFEKGSAWYGIATPAIFAVNAKGIVTHRFSTHNYRDRPEPEAVLEILKRAGG